MGRASDGRPDRRPEVHEHVLAELDLLLEDIRIWLSAAAARTDLRAPANARLDLDGNPAGEVTARDAEYAAAKLAKTLASLEAAAVAANGGERVKPAAIPPSPAPPAAKTLKERPVLRLPAFCQKCG